MRGVGGIGSPNWSVAPNWTPRAPAFAAAVVAAKPRGPPPWRGVGAPAAVACCGSGTRAVVLNGAPPVGGVGAPRGRPNGKVRGGGGMPAAAAAAAPGPSHGGREPSPAPTIAWLTAPPTFGFIPVWPMLGPPVVPPTPAAAVALPPRPVGPAGGLMFATWPRRVRAAVPTAPIIV